MLLPGQNRCQYHVVQLTFGKPNLRHLILISKLSLALVELPLCKGSNVVGPYISLSTACQESKYKLI